jgi:hypothetical protein
MQYGMCNTYITVGGRCKDQVTDARQARDTRQARDCKVGGRLNGGGRCKAVGVRTYNKWAKCIIRHNRKRGNSRDVQEDVQ